MKKLLGISLVAILTVSPMMAMAAVTDAEPTKATTVADTNVAAAAPQYALAQTGGNDNLTATAGYVKGAYNAAIKAVNKVSKDTTDELAKKQGILSAGKGVNITNDKVSADLTSNGGLKFSDDTDAATIGVDVGNGVELNAGKVTVKAKADGGITVDANGVSLTNGVQGATDTATYTSTRLTTQGYVDEKVDAALDGAVTLDGIQTLTNKTIDADDNTIQDLGTGNFKSGVVATTVGATGVDTALPTEKAVRTAITNATNGMAKQSGVEQTIKNTTYTSKLANTAVTGTITTLTTWNDDATTGTAAVSGSVTSDTVNTTVSNVVYAEPQS